MRQETKIHNLNAVLHPKPRGQAEIQFQCEKEETEQKGATFREQGQRNLLGQDAALHFNSNGASQSYSSSSFPRHAPSYKTMPLPLCWI